MEIDDFRKLDKKEQWQVILMFSSRMLDVACKENWQQLQNMDLLRRNLLVEFFNELPGEYRTLQMEKDIKHMLLIDESIIETIKASRDVLPEQIKTIHHGKKAVNEYLSNS